MGDQRHKHFKVTNEQTRAQCSMWRPSCFNVSEQAYFKDILCVLHSPRVIHNAETLTADDQH